MSCEISNEAKNYARRVLLRYNDDKKVVADCEEALRHPWSPADLADGRQSHHKCLMTTVFF